MILKILLFCIICLVGRNYAQYLNQSAISNNENRRGAEGAYAVANAFVDSMAPTFSNIINLNANNFTISDLQTNITNYFSGKDWRFYLDQVSFNAYFNTG
jgi:hypothetical protein